MGRLIFDEPPWWQRSHWRAAAAVFTTLAALAVWWAVLDDADRDAPIVPRVSHAPVAAVRPSPPPMTVMAPSVAPAASAAAPAAPAEPALSTMIEPGVHVTPLSVPPHTVPMPAGPRDHDTEPEN
jgi:hypothetical protein